MDPELLRLALVVTLLATASLAGMLWNRRDGRVQLVTLPAGEVSLASRLGLDGHVGTRAILFGSATCSPCDTVKSMLREVEAERDDFAWTYVDAAEHLDLADEHRVRRVPTLLVLDEDGSVRARTSGVPARDALRAAIENRPAELEQAS